MKNFSMHCFAVMMVLVGYFCTPAQAQIETANGAVNSPLSPELKARALLMRSENLDSYGLNLVGTWGLTRKDELRAIVPFLQRDGFGTSTTGLGDVYFRYKHSLSQTDGVMTSDRYAVLVDTSLPTGRTDVTGVPIRGQLGLGTPQVGLGFVTSFVRNRHRFSAEIGHRQPLGNDLAGTSRLNLAYWYRLTPAEFPEDEAPVEVRGVMELLTELRGPERGRDAGTLIWLAPGLQIYPSRTFQLELNAMIPVGQSLRDPLGDRQVGGSLTGKFRF